MKTTENYGFNLPEKTDFYDIEHLNKNFEAVDGKLKEFEDGTTPVGDTKKLGGKGASEYMEVAKYQPIADKAINTSIKELALTLDRGVYDFSLGGSSYTAEDLPSGGYKYGGATVFVRSSGAIMIMLWRGIANEVLATTYWNGSEWSKWTSLTTLEALMEYALPLSGGKISKTTTTAPLGINGGTHSLIEFLIDGVTSGGLGFSAKDKPVYTNSEWNKNYELLHTGNKPSGTYTGNGSATERTIALTNAIAPICSVRQGYWQTILGTFGGFAWNGNTGDTKVFKQSEVTMFSDGIHIKTAHEALNASGLSYSYSTP